jgi:hypothetical protein
VLVVLPPYNGAMSEGPHTPPNFPRETEHQPFCHKCGTEYAPGTNFCGTCGMPLSLIATIGPYETILARGFAYREATNNPRKLIVVIGMLMIFGPLFILATLGLRATVVALISGQANWGDQLLVVPFAIGGMYVSWRMISKTLRNYFRMKREAAENGDKV